MHCNFKCGNYHYDLVNITMIKVMTIRKKRIKEDTVMSQKQLRSWVYELLRGDPRYTRYMFLTRFSQGETWLLE